MRYLQILQTAKKLAIKNPIFWLFGLVLFGGFNLYLINFFALLPSGVGQTWPALLNSFFRDAPESFALVILSGVVLFVVLNMIKIFFVVYAHGEIHQAFEQHGTQHAIQQQCDLCIRTAARNFPYSLWVKNVILASSITVIVTSSIALTTGSIITKFAYDNTPVIMINVLFVALVTCAVGVWNLFTGYFVIVHGMGFAGSAKASLDLLLLRFRNVIEFVVILSVLYSLAVLIGNAFISLWQNGIMGLNPFLIRFAGLAIFIFWFALNNAFFNLALLVFFDRLVKSIGKPKEVLNGQLQANVLN